MEIHLKDYLHYYLGCEVINIYNKERYTLAVIGNGGYVELGQIGKSVGMHSVIDNIKPILRRIDSEMTAEEKKELTALDMEFNNSVAFYDIELWAEQTRWFCSKRIDVFGLIDANVAIDAATLTQTHNK